MHDFSASRRVRKPEEDPEAISVSSIRPEVLPVEMLAIDIAVHSELEAVTFEDVITPPILQHPPPLHDCGNITIQRGSVEALSHFMLLGHLPGTWQRNNITRNVYVLL